MAVFRLARLPDNWSEQPELFRRYWDETMNKIEDLLNDILAIPLIQAELANLETATNNAQAAADAANTAATNAQAAADAANNAAEEVAAETAIVNSYPTNFVAPLISADSAGNVTIANHDRKYGDSAGTTVAVTGGTFATTAVAAEIVRVYYDDAARTGGAVTYAYTVDPASPPVQSGNRHVVAAVEIPAAGTQSGSELPPPGYVDLR